jgi:acetyltransferase-like isoleucine patch superfamily enzyme
MLNMRLIRLIFSFFNKIWLLIYLKSNDIAGSSFYKFRVLGYQHNNIKITGCNTENCLVSIIGHDNTIECNNTSLSDTLITVTGNGNRIIVADNVVLRKATIIVRGDKCSLSIESNTTFGGIRIVNVGTNNSIKIGSDCLFSDNIELWASDTHSIYDVDGNFINAEKPVTIGNKVWIGSRVVILKGVTIHDGSIIGMGSIVTKDVPANVVSAGYPSKTLKENVSWGLDYKQGN